MIAKIGCPKCGTEGSFSLADLSYEGPYRCWKCRSLFTILIANKRLQSMEPLSEEDFAKWQKEREAQKKMGLQ